jgi:hypothetical protein
MQVTGCSSSSLYVNAMCDFMIQHVNFFANFKLILPSYGSCAGLKGLEKKTETAVVITQTDTS